MSGAKDVQNILKEYSSMVDKMVEKEERLMVILRKNNMEGYYVEVCADALIRLTRSRRTINALANMYYVVGGVRD